MNCQFCFYYHKEKHRCLYDNTPTGNVNTCQYWRPNLYILSRQDIPEFGAYDQYRKDKKTNEKSKKKKVCY